MPSEEFVASFLDAEITLRRQLLLRGYELGLGGQRLEPEAAVAFLEEHYQRIFLDAHAAIREERHDLMRAAEAERARWKAELQSLKDSLGSGSKKSLPTAAGDGAGSDERAGWQTASVALLARQLALQPTMLAVRKGRQRGIAVNQRRPRSFWKRVWRRPEAARLAVCWEDGTSTMLSDQDDISWRPVIIPD